MDDLTIDQEFLLAIGDGNVDLLGELLSPLKEQQQQQQPEQRRQRQRQQRTRRRAGITDDFLHDILCFFFKCNTFHPQVCRLLCNSLSPSLIQDYQTGRRDSHLFAAATYGRVEALKFLVVHFGDIFDIHQLYNGRPLFYHAAITRYHTLQQSREMCRFLVSDTDECATVNSGNTNSGGTCTACAVVDPNQLDSAGWTTLNHVVRINHTELAALLLEECHADPCIVARGQCESNVDHAIFRGNARILALLLQHGAVLNNFVILVGILSQGMYPVVNLVQQQNTRPTKLELCRALAHHITAAVPNNNHSHSDNHSDNDNDNDKNDSITFETVQVTLECAVYLGYNDICAIFFEAGLPPTFRIMYCAIDCANEAAARLLVQYGIDPWAHVPYEFDVVQVHDYVDDHQENDHHYHRHHHHCAALSPFHAAARDPQSTVVFEYFMNLWNHDNRRNVAGRAQDTMNRSDNECPIHVLCRDPHVSIRAIQLLVEKFHANVSQPLDDRNGRQCTGGGGGGQMLPFQSAILSNASLDVIYYLLNRFPSALWWQQQPSERRCVKNDTNKPAQLLLAHSTHTCSGESAGSEKVHHCSDMRVQELSDAPPTKKLKASSSQL
jgi:hypothetical protein